VRILWGVLLLASLVINSIGKAEEKTPVRSRAPLSPLAQYLEDVFFGSGRRSVPRDRNPFNWSWDAVSRNPALSKAFNELAEKRGENFKKQVQLGIQNYDRLNAAAAETTSKNLGDLGVLEKNPAREVLNSLAAFNTRKRNDGAKKPQADISREAMDETVATHPAAFNGPFARGLNDPAAARIYNQSVTRQEVQDEISRAPGKPKAEDLKQWLREELEHSLQEQERNAKTMWTRLGQNGLVQFTIGDEQASEPFPWNKISTLQLVTRDGEIGTLRDKSGRKLSFSTLRNPDEKRFAINSLHSGILYDLSDPVPGSRGDIATREAFYLSEINHNWHQAYTIAAYGLNSDPPNLEKTASELLRLSQGFQHTTLPSVLKDPYRARQIAPPAYIGLLYSTDASHWRERSQTTWADAWRKGMSFEDALLEKNNSPRKKKAKSRLRSATDYLLLLGASAVIGVGVPASLPPRMLQEVHKLSSPNDFHAGEDRGEAFNKDRDSDYMKTPVLHYSSLEGHSEKLPDKLIVASVFDQKVYQWSPPKKEVKGSYRVASKIGAGNGPISIPTPEGSYLVRLEVKDAKGNVLDASRDYQPADISGSNDGYFIYSRPGKTIPLGLTFTADFAPKTNLPSSLGEEVAPADGILRAADRLERSGHVLLPRVMREAVEIAEAEKIPIKVKHLQFMLSENGLYSDVPERWQALWPFRSKEDRLARFLNEDGTHCSQCDGYRELSELVLSDVFEGNDAFKMRPRLLFKAAEGDVLRRDFHTDLYLNLGNKEGNFDATSGTMDPRNEAKPGIPPPVDKQDPFFVRIVGLFARAYQQGAVGDPPTEQEPTIVGPSPKDSKTPVEMREVAEPISRETHAVLASLREDVQRLKKLAVKYKTWSSGVGNERLPHERMIQLADLMEAYARGEMDEAKLRSGLDPHRPVEDMQKVQTIPEILTAIADRFDRVLESHRQAYTRGETKAFPGLTQSDFAAAIRAGFRRVAQADWAPPGRVRKPYGCAATLEAIYASNKTIVRR